QQRLGNQWAVGHLM
nr:RecName: Full=Bombesin [Bombina bombina]